MTLLPIVDRELRVAARQAKTYRTRWGTAGVFLLLLAWMLWLIPWRSWFNSREAFEVMAWAAFWWCLLAGPLRTSDSLSHEKRENTLGLLFLTDLKGYDVVLGKLLSSSADAFLGLLGIFPVLAIPMLLGGVSLAEFGRVTISLTNTMFVSLSLGLFVSALGRDARRTTLLVVLILVLFSLVTLGIAEALQYYFHAPAWADAVRLVSLMNAHDRALQTSVWARSLQFWPTFFTTHLLGLCCLALSSWVLPSAWQDSPKRSKEFFLKWSWQHFRSWNLGQAAAGKLFRTRSLACNPFLWLMARERVCSLGLLLCVLTVLCAGLWFFWEYVAPTLRGRSSPFEGFLIGWVFFAMGAHMALLIQIAVTASHRLAEDRINGALELILSTPLTVGRILRGHALALLRQTGGMVLAVLFVHFILLWAVLTMIGLEDRPSATVSELLIALWRVFWDGSNELDWHIPFIFIVPVVALLLLVAHWITLSLVGAWVGLRVKHARNAPWIALPLVLFPPWPFFLIGVAWLNEIHFLLGEREALYLGLGLAIGLNLLSDLVLSLWASNHLRRDFRLVASVGFRRQKATWSGFLRSRSLRRLATAGAAIALLAFCFYQIELWRGQRAWKQVLRDVESRGESLSYKAMLPDPVPSEQNFFAAPVFGAWIDYLEDPPAHGWREPPELQRLRSVTLWGRPGVPLPGSSRLNLGDWQNRQAKIDFRPWQTHFRGQRDFPKTDQAQDPVGDVLLALTRYEVELSELRSASRRSLAVFRANPRWPGIGEQGELFWNLASVLRFRATALLAAGRFEEAIQDVRLILYLADSLGGQPTLNTLQSRARIAMQAVQPIWEGVVDHCWTERDLTILQHLLEVNLLESYATAVRGETLLQIERWDALLASDSANHYAYTSRGPGLFVAMQLYPSGWIQWHKANLYCRMQDSLLPLIDPRRRCVTPTKELRDGETELPAGPPAPRFPSGGKALYLVENIARSQASIELARAACALERFRLAHGQYPERLESLTPVYLDLIPTDVMTSDPLHYQSNRDGSFVLYSVGWNGRDDGADSTRDLDWVWSWPPK